MIASTAGITWISDIAGAIANVTINPSVPPTEIKVASTSGATFVTLADVENDGECSRAWHVPVVIQGLRCILSMSWLWCR